MRTAAPNDRFSPSQIVLPGNSAAYAWDAHFVKSHPEKRTRIALAALATFGCALAVFHQMIIAVFATGVLLASIAEFLLPLRYTLDSQGARVSCGPITWLEMPWSDVRSIYQTGDGVKLSIFRSPRTAFLEPLRGITLRCSPEMLPSVMNAAQTFRSDTEARTAP